MKIWNPIELATFAGHHSNYYKELYKNSDFSDFENLPIIDQQGFWATNERLTAKASGMVFRSGGTTGSPKFSYFTMQEWNDFTAEFATGMDQAGFRAFDRVANLFYAGDLYASFLFINKSIEQMKTEVVSLPVGGHLSSEAILNCLSSYDVEVICGVPTTLMSLKAVATKPLEGVRQIFYGGEALFEDQLNTLRELFPNAHFSSIGYASVDGGHLGYSVEGEQRGIHHVFSKTTLMEIIDIETGNVIRKANKQGRLVYTNLIRSLMPIIRYPVGDMGSWVEGRVGEVFKLAGRTDEGARVGPVTFNRDDFTAVLAKLGLQNQVVGFQFEIDRTEALDRLTIKFASSAADLDVELIRSEILKERPMLSKAILSGLIAPLQVLLTKPENLAVNPRTGKLSLVLDKRFK